MMDDWKHAIAQMRTVHASMLARLDGMAGLIGEMIRAVEQLQAATRSKDNHDRWRDLNDDPV